MQTGALDHVAMDRIVWMESVSVIIMEDGLRYVPTQLQPSDILLLFRSMVSVLMLPLLCYMKTIKTSSAYLTGVTARAPVAPAIKRQHIRMSVTSI